MRNRHLPLAEPTDADLDAIDAEWPLIEAEMAVLDAQISLIYAAGRSDPSPLDWRRLRRAEARVIRVAAELASRVPLHVIDHEAAA